MNHTSKITYKYSGWFGFAPILISDVDDPMPVICERWTWVYPLLSLAEFFASMSPEEGYVFHGIKELKTPIVVEYEVIDEHD